MGVAFFDVPNRPLYQGYRPVSHRVKPEKGGPSRPGALGTLIKRLTEKAEKLGVQIILKTPAQQILKNGDRITGVLAADKDEKTIRINAKTVIVATGGFGDNPEWIKKYTGFKWGNDIFSMRIAGLVGDGLRLAWAAGAAKSETTMDLIYALPGPAKPEVSIFFAQPNLMVNILGERFCNEEVMQNRCYAANTIAEQKGRCAFMIFDNAARKHYEANGIDYPNLIYPVEEFGNFATNIKQVIKDGNTNMFFADSIEELAAKTGINPDVLRQTIREYNKACATGKDGIFHKNPKFLRPVKQPKYYAARYYPGGYSSMGGIKINYKTEVLDKNWAVIPGFYAAGVDANNIYRDTYLLQLAGNTMGWALNSGRIAGENAAKFIKK
jgi:fumarate reductase flavoprotein subunit